MELKKNEIKLASKTSQSFNCDLKLWRHKSKSNRSLTVNARHLFDFSNIILIFDVTISNHRHVYRIFDLV